MKRDEKYFKGCILGGAIGDALGRPIELKKLKEIKATMLVVVVCFLWHVLTAFLLNSKGGTLFRMPLWFVVSVFGTIILAIIGVFWLLKFVFVDFSYDEEECEDEQ